MDSTEKRESPGRIYLACKRTLMVAAVALFAAVGAGPVAAPGQAVAELRGDAILDHLNQVIDWYRHALTRVQTVGLPSDAMYQFNAQSMASEAAQLAFQSAQAEALLIPAATPASAGAGETTSQQNIAKLQSDVDARISALKAQISALDQQIPGARKAKLQDLTAQKERAQHGWAGRQHQRTAAFRSGAGERKRRQDGSQAGQRPRCDACLRRLDWRSGSGL
jgi:hypothetical protein